MAIPVKTSWADNHPIGFQRFRYFKAVSDLAFLLYFAGCILYGLFLLVRGYNGGNIWFDDPLFKALSLPLFYLYAFNVVVALIDGYLETGGFKLFSTLNALFLAAVLGAAGWHMLIYATNPPPTLVERIMLADGIRERILKMEQDGSSTDELEAMCVWYAQEVKRSGGWVSDHPKSCAAQMQ